MLDTWFSSALIPLCVAGWPHREIEGEVLELMQTGHDIIGFWVARMLTVGKRWVVFRYPHCERCCLD